MKVASVWEAAEFSVFNLMEIAGWRRCRGQTEREVNM